LLEAQLAQLQEMAKQKSGQQLDQVFFFFSKLCLTTFNCETFHDQRADEGHVPIAEVRTIQIFWKLTPHRYPAHYRHHRFLWCLWTMSLDGLKNYKNWQ
jgi:hypothetical protein